MSELPPSFGWRPDPLVRHAAVDDATLARIIPLWIGRTPDGEARPSVIFGGSDALISADSPNPCTGVWQLHLFAFSYEARQALQTIKLLMPHLASEAASRPTGEGMTLIRVADGPFGCSIVDRRNARGVEPLLGSWDVSDAVARQAALHIPRAAWGRARQAARHVVSELNDPTEKAELCALLGCKNRLDARVFGQVRLEDVLAAANRLLEPTGLEVTCPDRQVLDFIDARIADEAFDTEAIVKRIAHSLVAELAETGGLG